MSNPSPNTAEDYPPWSRATFEALGATFQSNQSVVEKIDRLIAKMEGFEGRLLAMGAYLT
jgi:hypothetical protein